MKHYTILTADGFRVAVTEGGSGIPLIFLHGLSVSAAAYTEMLELLAGNGFHVFAFDCPDHGGSDSLPWGHTVKDMADVIWKALISIEQFQLNYPVVVGHSMGGWIAAELAAAHPEWMYTLILLDAAVGREFHESVRLRSGAQFLAGAVRDVYGDVRKAGSIRKLGERLSLISRLTSSVSGPGILRAINAVMHSDSTETLRSLMDNDVNTVIVHGHQDGIVPWKSGLSAAHAAGASFKLLGGRYHSWMISDPELALRVINEALDLTDNNDDDEGDAA